MAKKDISKYYADEVVIRLIAVQVIIITLLSLWQGWRFPLLFLAADFALRAFTYLPAPLAAIAKITASFLQLKPKPVFAAPKKFAAGVGFAFSLITFISLLLDYTTVAYATGGIMIFCALLEAAFKICAGCYLYNWVVSPVINSRNNLTR